jgi:hypothetical protein
MDGLIPMFNYLGPGQFWVNQRAAKEQGRTIVDSKPGQVKWQPGMNVSKDGGMWQASEKFGEWAARKNATVYAVYMVLVPEEYRSAAVVGVPFIL